MLLRLSIYRVARGIGRALGQLQLEITFDGVQGHFCVVELCEFNISVLTKSCLSDELKIMPLRHLIL